MLRCTSYKLNDEAVAAVFLPIPLTEKSTFSALCAIAGPANRLRHRVDQHLASVLVDNGA